MESHTKTATVTINRFPFQQIDQLSQKDIAYATKNPGLRPFYKYEANLEAFEQVIADKSNDPINRQVLVEVLREQYAGLDISAATSANIDALEKGNTFTVTTAHQPSLATGPLYYIYKIISTIHLAGLLNETYPAYHFVPVFITGGEDHDFEEVNHFNLFNNKIVWENEESGSVGMMKTDSLQPVLDTLKEILGEKEEAKTIYQIIEAAYTQNKIYAQATIDLVNRLFGDYGLVTMSMNAPILKRQFIPFLKKELLERPSQALVEAATAQLEAAGFSGQAHAREINLFYLRDQLRERIVLEDGLFKVLNTDYVFTEEALLQEVDQHPEHFSPNVVMRPLYQEAILPNLAYIGGGGEIAYWLERKAQFAHFGLNFPMLIRRNSVLWIDGGTKKRMEKLGLSTTDLFTETETLIKQFITQNTANELSLQEEKEKQKELFDAIRYKAEEIDPTLAKAVMAEQVKQLNVLNQLEGRLMRAEKQKHETALNQIRSLKEKLFPNNGLQERHDNFLSLYLQYGRHFFEVLLDHLNPLEEGFIIIEE
ncbi:MAG: bacillithiol biosynthesis cysteine-adding enzyme BshC [Saprospiraceae bacterium]